MTDDEWAELLERAAAAGRKCDEAGVLPPGSFGGHVVAGVGSWEAYAVAAVKAFGRAPSSEGGL